MRSRNSSAAGNTAGVKPSRLFFNGLDGATGDYCFPPRPLAELAGNLRRGRIRPEQVSKAAEAGIDPRDLSSAGWGVVFPERVDPAIREALKPLLDLRRGQATRRDERLFRELDYLPEETKRRFLPRHGAAPGPVSPPTMPYYLLLIGDPGEIPFDLQLELEVQYAVGRLAFDRIEDFARYAQQVVEHEQGGIVRPSTAALFGVRNENDPATEDSDASLVRPLLARLVDRHPSWRFENILGRDATRARLGQVLSGSETPALLFTAGHAVLFRADHPRQRDEQGALVCYDWPGPGGWRGPIPEEHLFAARDLTTSASLSGMVTFHFACCSAGTPKFDAFSMEANNELRQLAREAFVAQLPQRLLAGGALAVIGHVERAWPHSFLWDGAGSQVGVFASTLGQILAGDPVGLAMEDFGLRYAEIATELLDLRAELKRRNVTPSRSDLEDEVRLWTAYQDARHYLLLGDPAVRLRTDAL